MRFGSFADIIFQWEYLGVFDFILPFLLIFAVVFGILGQMKIFGDRKGIHVIIAIVLGLLASRFPLFTDFLNIVSPRLGIGLVVLLALLILVGMFSPGGQRGIIAYILMGVGVIIFIVVITSSFDIFGFGYGAWGFTDSELIGYVLLIAALIGVIVAVVVSGSSGSGHSSEHKLKDGIKALFGEG